MRAFLHRTKRNPPNRVGWPTSSSAQATARVARQSLAAIGRVLEGGDGDGHREALPWRTSSAAGLASGTERARCLLSNLGETAAPAQGKKMGDAPRLLMKHVLH
jgi:hypothetical protein